MTSHDLRDVLDLPSSDHGAGPRPNKKQKTNALRPNLKGLAREVQNLGGDNPIAIVPEVTTFKKRRYASRKPAARWELKPFFNSARGDDGALILRHWRRKTDNGNLDGPDEEGESRSAEEAPEGGQKPEDSAFAKFNVRVAVPQYNDDQYASNLQHADWTKEETGYLLALARDYDLRWPLMWDRYDFIPRAVGADDSVDNDSMAVVPAPKPRTMEDLKARYYEVAAKMMAVQKPAQYMTRPEFELYELMLNFDPAQERSRKEFARNTLARSKDEAREEEALLVEMKRILARTERFNEERRELYERLDYPATDADITSFKTSQGLAQLLQNLLNADKAKKRKSLMGPGEGPTPTSAVPGSAVSEVPPHRRESIAASVTNHRESLGGTPATPVEPTAAMAAANKKKGAQQPERRKLTTLEEQTYGVSYHDRLGSGPTFRYEKINKLFGHKSGQQQARITNVLSELDIPARLAMPTAGVTSQFEQLWSAVVNLVDLRKASDKLDADIKVEEAKKAERDKARAAKGGDASGSSAPKPSEDAAAAKQQSGAGGGDTGAEPAAQGPLPPQEKALQNGTGPPEPAGAGDETGLVGEKQEQGDEKEKGDLRPSSAGTHKRSASVLSTTSDKSAKRQRK